MGNRAYSIVVDAQAVSALQDIINITATSGMAFRLIQVQLGQKTLTGQEAKEIKIVRFPATVTAGSGGSAVTPQKFNNGDAAATVTARRNDTTPMTTSGAASTLVSDDWIFTNGWLWVPATIDQAPIIAPSQGLAITLPTAPSGSMTVSATAIIEELF